MADVLTYARRSTETPIQAHSPTIIPFQVDLPASGIIDTDEIRVLTIPAGYVMLDCFFGPDATLGASCTLTGRIGTTAITGKTTATATTPVRMSVLPDTPTTADRYFNLLVDDANVSSAASVRGYVVLAHAGTFGVTV